jgi:hypothetical protein
LSPRHACGLALLLVALQVQAQEHTLEAELRSVHEQLRGGEVRAALALLAHTTAEHRESREAAGLYACLLALTAQRAGDDACAEPLRMVTSGEALPPDAKPVAGAVLLPSGREAVAPLSALEGHDRFWLRDAFGQTVRATVARRADDLGVALLELDSPGVVGVTVQAAAREPFAGSPGYVVDYLPRADAQAAWPWLSTGFLGRATPHDTLLRPLGIDTSAPSNGAPVFDAEGRLAGITLARPFGTQWLPWSALSAWLGAPREPDTPPSASQRASAAEVYERALHSALQLIAASP